jgi:hypothetical protein
MIRCDNIKSALLTKSELDWLLANNANVSVIPVQDEVYYSKEVTYIN